MERSYLSEALSEINRMYKEMDAIYHGFALKFGFSDSMFWILYILSESEGGITQYELCSEWGYSKQTIHSAISALERNGYVCRRETLDARNRKLLTLTVKGRELTDRTIHFVKAAEIDALGGLSEKECSEFLRLNDRYLQLFRKESKNINHSSEDCPSQRESRL